MKTAKTWFESQPYSFRMGALDRNGGEQFDSSKNEKWQEGWRWANRTLVRHSR
ncbi:MAG: hypothetical protein AB2387_00710 [Stutzerimonas stutzeri]